MLQSLLGHQHNKQAIHPPPCRAASRPPRQGHRQVSLNTAHPIKHWAAYRTKPPRSFAGLRRLLFFEDGGTTQPSAVAVNSNQISISNTVSNQVSSSSTSNSDATAIVNNPVRQVQTFAVAGDLHLLQETPTFPSTRSLQCGSNCGGNCGGNCGCNSNSERYSHWKETMQMLNVHVEPNHKLPWSCILVRSPRAACTSHILAPRTRLQCTCPPA